MLKEADAVIENLRNQIQAKDASIALTKSCADGLARDNNDLKH